MDYTEAKLDKNFAIVRKCKVTKYIKAVSSNRCSLPHTQQQFNPEASFRANVMS